jgi:hypothetical protein
MSDIQSRQSAQISYLYSQLGGVTPVPTSSNLADVLINGNSAGSNSINMNNNDITGVKDISGKQILLEDTTLGTEFTLYQRNEIQVSDGATTTTFFTPTDLQYNDGTFISATWEDIINTTNTPIIPTLQQVLDTGNTAIDDTIQLQSTTTNTTNDISNLGVSIQNATGSTIKNTLLDEDKLDIKITNGITSEFVGSVVGAGSMNMVTTSLTTPEEVDMTFNNIAYTDNTGTTSATWANIINSANTDDTLQEVLNAGNTAINADLIILTSANDQQIKLNGTSANGIQITTPNNVSLRPYASYAGVGIDQSSTSSTFLTATSQLVRIRNTTGGGGGNSETSIRGGEGTLNETNITALSTGVNYTSVPTIQIHNNNTTAGNTNGVPSVEYYKLGRNAVQNDVIATQIFSAKNYLGNKTQFGKIESVITNTSAPAGDDGALDFYTCVNGTSSLVMRLNGADNENNSFRPLDMNGNAIKTSTGNMSFDTSSSTGTGTITFSPKNTSAVVISSANDSTNDFISINPQTSANTQRLLMTATDAGTGFINSIDMLNSQYNPSLRLKADFGGATNKSVTIDVNGNGSTPNSITSYDGQTNLPFQIVSSGITNGSIEFVPQDTTGDIIFTGTNIESSSSGSNSGQHLRIKLNGTYYKIKLEND